MSLHGLVAPGGVEQHLLPATYRAEQTFVFAVLAPRRVCVLVQACHFQPCFSYLIKLVVLTLLFSEGPS